jgi:hypothetical protein
MKKPFLEVVRPAQGQLPTNQALWGSLFSIGCLKPSCKQPPCATGKRGKERILFFDFKTILLLLKIS